MKKLLILPLLALVLGVAAPAVAAQHGTTYTNAKHGYRLTLPKGWYAHETNASTVFTKKKHQRIPEHTDGYALAPLFTSDVQRRINADGQVISRNAWLKLNVGTVDGNGKKLEQRWANVNGRQMLEVIGTAAGAEGKQISYFYFTPKRVFHFFQYPYVQGSTATTSFQRALFTLKIN